MKPEAIEKEIVINGLRVYTYKFKHIDGRPTAIATHGLRNDTLKNYPLISLLEDHFNVIAFDFPGHGKSKDYNIEDNYIELCAKTLKGIIDEFEVDTNNAVLVGGSFGANVIIKYLVKNSEVEFKEVGLLAPVFSKQTLSIPTKRKNFILKLTRALTEKRWFFKLFQLIVTNRLSLFIMVVMYYQTSDLEFIKHEMRLWQICPMDLWGKSILDLFELDNSTLGIYKGNTNITFVYPRKDQYLDVTNTIEGYKKIFPLARFKNYKSDMHMPIGDWSENEEFMSSMREVLYSSLG